MEMDVVIRRLTAEDDLEKLTELLHRSYKKLLDRGFRFLASHQDLATTKNRIDKGEGYAAEIDGKVVGTVTYYAPKLANRHEWYDRQDVAFYGQFAVEPEYQNSGIGGKLIEFVEELAIRDNAKEIAVDTAEGATELINYYKKRGYRFVGYAQWSVTNYRSVVLSKNLEDNYRT
jgi:GNAT superfamily N-acetyltransferase